MSMKRTLGAVLILAALSACGVAVPPSRNAVLPILPSQISTAPGEVIAGPQELAVLGIEIAVPQTLRTSEANVLVPSADIVWRGDPLGERHEQVAAIFQNAAAKATEGFTDGRGVIVSVEVTRFHALTEKARYLTGGNYALHFILTVRDAATGELIDGPRPIIADVRASGGIRAIAEDNAGRTEKVVITERLVSVLYSELKNLMVEPAV